MAQGKRMVEIRGIARNSRQSICSVSDVFGNLGVNYLRGSGLRIYWQIAATRPTPKTVSQIGRKDWQ